MMTGGDRPFRHFGKVFPVLPNKPCRVMSGQAAIEAWLGAVTNDPLLPGRIRIIW